MSIFAKLYGIPREKRLRTIKQLLKEVDPEKLGRETGEDVFRRHAGAGWKSPRPGT